MAVESTSDALSPVSVESKRSPVLAIYSGLVRISGAKSANRVAEGPLVHFATAIYAGKRRFLHRI